MRDVRDGTIVAALVLVFGVAGAASAQLHATLVAGGFSSPVGFVQDPSDPTVQMVLEQGGHVRVLKSGVVQGADFLDVSGLLPAPPLGERGLLGLAFAPDYAMSGRVYVSFNNSAGHSVISRYTRSAGNALQANAASRFDLVWPGGAAYITQPYTNHNGGNIAFGPDGYLYIGLGDGGSANDPQHHAQNPLSLLGKMLRIDVSVADSDPEGYDVPGSNPFVGVAGVRPEIWSFGLRNPWRWSFDAAGSGGTGALVIGDVGQGTWEEVDYEPTGVGGRNYGWRNREGAHDNVTSLPAYSSPLRDPIWEYNHTVGASITGGFVYRGTALGAAYTGRYFFGDFARSRFWSLGLALDPVTHDATVTLPLEHTSELGVASPTSFGVDAAGEIYIVSYGGGVYRIDPEPGPTPGGCGTPDPFVSLGGGTCLAGIWHSPRLPGDFNNDLLTDLVFQSTAGQLYSWYMSGTTLSSAQAFSPASISAGLTVTGVNDFTGDGKPDLLVQNQTTGAFDVYVMNGLTRTSQQPFALAASSPWRIMATGDVNGDGYADILWGRLDTGQYYVWFMRPTSGTAAFIGGGYLKNSGGIDLALGATAWRIVGTGDVNRDGRTDIVWQNDSTGALKVSLMNGLLTTSEVALSPGTVSPAWKIRSVADFNGDQRPDLIWQHTTTGDLYVWFMSGTTLTQGSYLTPPRVNSIWMVAGPK